MTAKQKVDEISNGVQTATTKFIGKSTEIAKKGVAAVGELEQKIAETMTKSSNKVSEAATRMGHDVKHVVTHAVHVVEEKAQEEKIRATAFVEMASAKLKHSAGEKTEKGADAADELTQKAKHATDRAASKPSN